MVSGVQCRIPMSALRWSIAHDTAAFLSWHRWFLHIYEGVLQQQCGYSGHLTYAPSRHQQGLFPLI